MEISSKVQAELDNYNKEMDKWLAEHSPLGIEDIPKRNAFFASLKEKLSPEAQKAKQESLRGLQKRMKSQLQDD